MKLLNLLRDVSFVKDERDLLEEDIAEIRIDHRYVEKGDVFIALKGQKYNGNDFIEEAFKKGARCVISDEAVFDERIINVESARSAYAIISKNYFDRACDDIRIIAITGTNGKTTTCNVIADILKGAGYKVGVIGTLGAKIDGEFIDTGFTTPDPYILHSIFHDMKLEHVDYVVMEASAHALALSKLDGIKFEIGLLTNITEDHLDFFGDMGSYADAKLKLFDKNRTTLGIYCQGKDFTERLKEKSDVKLLSYGLESGCDFEGKIIERNFEGSHFQCFDYKGDIFDVKIPLVGGFNVENALASIAVCKSLGVNDWGILRGFEYIKPVEGRFNVIKNGNVNIVVDFAHTPDGLEKVLKTAGELTDGKIVAIFGCGGNRDRQKRPIMGRIASQYADEVILTSDNPRYEDPVEIINEIKEGVKGSFKVIPDRRSAIAYALKTYQGNETIIIAGKGAEKYQEIRGVKYPYNDFDEINKALATNFEQIEDSKLRD